MEEEKKEIKKNKKEFAILIIVIVLVAGFGIYYELKEPEIVFTYEIPADMKDMAPHCRYNLWYNSSGFSLIFSLNSSDCDSARITNRCNKINGVLGVHEDFLEDYPNATVSFSSMKSGKKINLNHVQCSIYMNNNTMG